MKKIKVTPSNATATTDELDGLIDPALLEKPRVLFFEDDDFIKKWSGPIILGPFALAVYSLIIIVTGEIILSAWVGSCGYPLNC